MNETAEDIRYFIYSKTQLKDRAEIEKNIGKKFFAGSIIIYGKSHAYTQMVKSLDGIRYSDYKIVARVDINTAKYTQPYSK